MKPDITTDDEALPSGMTCEIELRESCIRPFSLVACDSTRWVAAERLRGSADQRTAGRSLATLAVVVAIRPKRAGLRRPLQAGGR
jgi:hypothetical protein